MDAGAVVSLTNSTGAVVSMPLVLPGIYQGNIASANTGVYTLSNGAGGADVPKFSVNFNGPPAFTWMNSQTATVTRSSGYTVRWAGGDANSVVNIQGQAPGNPVTVNGNLIQTNSSVSFLCQVAANTGSFTIPASVLYAMPVSLSSTTPNGSLTVELATNPQIISIPGVDIAIAATNTAQVSGNVIFQ
jgi:hypothetical protein